MIPNTTPCYGKDTFRDVVAWSDDGEPLAVNYKTGRLVVMREPLTHDDERIVQVVPATGWEVVYNVGTDDEHASPIIGWGLTAAGDVCPLDSDVYGEVATVRNVTPQPHIRPIKMKSA